MRKSKMKKETKIEFNTHNNNRIYDTSDMRTSK